MPKTTQTSCSNVGMHMHRAGMMAKTTYTPPSPHPYIFLSNINGVHGARNCH